MKNTMILVWLFVALAACSNTPVIPSTGSFTTVAGDGVIVHGERYLGDLGPDAPLILLFHQGGSNGRGEYTDIAAWLNGEGFRAIAWDQRSGGNRYGADNRTKAGMPEGTSIEYCDAYPDLQAALDYVTEIGLAERVIVWGSSYSGALVYRLAAENPERACGVIAFSPASGGPMKDCRARLWLDQIRAPMAAFKPRSEMARESSIEQQRLMTAAGVTFDIVENGVHGSSMLLDGRTNHDMSVARQSVVQWLRRTVNADSSCGKF